MDFLDKCIKFYKDGEIIECVVQYIKACVYYSR